MRSVKRILQVLCLLSIVAGFQIVCVSKAPASNCQALKHQLVLAQRALASAESNRANNKDASALLDWQVARRKLDVVSANGQDLPCLNPSENAHYYAMRFHDRYLTLLYTQTGPGIVVDADRYMRNTLRNADRWKKNSTAYREMQLYGRRVHQLALFLSQQDVRKANVDSNSDTCSRPDVPAALAQKVVPQMPEMAVEQGAAGTVAVKVSLSENGSVLGTSLDRTSGNASLDQEAIKAARQSTYYPARANCTAVPSTYLFVVEFRSPYHP